MKSNRKLRWLIFAAMWYLSLCVIGGIWIADGTLHPQRRLLVEQEAGEFRQSVLSMNAQVRDVAIVARDGIKLQAWVVRPSQPNGDAAVLLHGLADNRLGMTGYAKLLLARGFTVLLPDARAHGASGGNVASFGILERYDIAQWVQFLRSETKAGCIFGIGESMGAAQLLQSVGAGTAFCSVIAESSFSNFPEIAYDRMGQPFHLGPWVGRTVLRPMVEAAFLRARWKYDLNIRSISPEDAVSEAHVPVLLIHGEMDSNIPVRHSRRIHERDPDTTLCEVPGADHCGAFSVAPEHFEKLLAAWFSADSGLMKRIAVQ